MSFANTFINACSILGDAMRGAEQASLMASARTEPDPIVRQQKIQMVLQLPQVTNNIVRGQIVTEIIHRSK